MADSRRLAELAAGIRARAAVLPIGSVAVALSGGADSATAAWLVAESGALCRGLHIDHGLPGSPVLRQAAVAVADRLGINIDVLEISVPEGASAENQARIARYAALEGALDGGEWLVTGHTSDDQAETVLLNILRGSGLDGLAGIPSGRGMIVRPLLGVSRSETREMATLLGLQWRDDPSNDELEPRRNQIRRVLIPDLEARFNPRLRDALAGLAETVSAELSSRSQRVQIRTIDSGVALPAPELHAVGPVAAAHAVREAIRRVRGPHPGVRREIQQLLEVAGGVSSSVELAGGIKGTRRGPWLIIQGALSTDRQPALRWEMPGSLRFGDFLLDSWTEDQPPVAFPLSSWTAVADADRFPPSTTVRITERGDEIDGVSVVEQLRQIGIDPARRSRWPVVEVRGSILWVPGARISRSVWVGSTTRRYLWVHAALETE